MQVHREKLWENENKAEYTMYLQDNSCEIEEGRRHPAIIICGGGGFLGICDREKEPVALFFLNHGYQAFVLDYNTSKIGDGRYPNPVYDIANMILIIRKKADQWNIDPEKIAVIGFSAGAHLCACLATQWQEEYLRNRLQAESELLKPNAVILSYPLTDYICQIKWLESITGPEVSQGIDDSLKLFFDKAMEAGIGKNPTEANIRKASPIYHVTNQVPPVFIWHTATDEMVYVANSLRFAERLVEEGIPCELHMFESGPHGLSLANTQTADKEEMVNSDVAIWSELAVKFLKRHFNIQG